MFGSTFASASVWYNTTPHLAGLLLVLLPESDPTVMQAIVYKRLKGANSDPQHLHTKATPREQTHPKTK